MSNRRSAGAVRGGCAVSLLLLLSSCGDPVGEDLSRFHRGSSYADLKHFVLSIGGSCSDLPASAPGTPGALVAREPMMQAAQEHQCSTPPRKVFLGSYQLAQTLTRAMDCRVKPGNDEVFVGQLITVMAGLDPAIHSAARTVKIRVFWYHSTARFLSPNETTRS